VTLTFELELYGVMANQHAKRSKVPTDTDGRPIALPGPLEWSGKWLVLFVD